MLMAPIGLLTEEEIWRENVVLNPTMLVEVLRARCPSPAENADGYRAAAATPLTDHRSRGRSFAPKGVLPN